MAKRSVQNILKEPPIKSPESAPTARSRGVGRPSAVKVYQCHVRCILKEEPPLPTVEVLSRLRGLGYTGGKSEVSELVKTTQVGLGNPSGRHRIGKVESFDGARHVGLSGQTLDLPDDAFGMQVFRSFTHHGRLYGLLHPAGRMFGST